MKPIYEERNTKMRQAYYLRTMEQKMESVDAIYELMDLFSEWNLTYETTRQIVTNRKYGSPAGGRGGSVGRG